MGGLIQQELNIDLEKKNSNKTKRKLINKINRTILLWLAKDKNILLWGLLRLSMEKIGGIILSLKAGAWKPYKLYNEKPRAFT